MPVRSGILQHKVVDLMCFAHTKFILLVFLSVIINGVDMVISLPAKQYARCWLGNYKCSQQLALPVTDISEVHQPSRVLGFVYLAGPSAIS